MPVVAAQLRGLTAADHVTTIDHRNGWWLTGLLKVVVTRLQLLPEVLKVGIFMALHIGVGHAERVNTHLHARLTKHQRTSNELEYLINTLIVIA
ncbi:Uncharacterised protein [Escherichia coli]|nr:Uncharacterised protein [Escherichia coli]